MLLKDSTVFSVTKILDAARIKIIYCNFANCYNFCTFVSCSFLPIMFREILLALYFDLFDICLFNGTCSSISSGGSKCSAFVYVYPLFISFVTEAKNVMTDFRVFFFFLVNFSFLLVYTVKSQRVVRPGICSYNIGSLLSSPFQSSIAISFIPVARRRPY